MDSPFLSRMKIATVYVMNKSTISVVSDTWYFPKHFYYKYVQSLISHTHSQYIYLYSSFFLLFLLFDSEDESTLAVEAAADTASIPPPSTGLEVSTGYKYRCQR